MDDHRFDRFVRDLEAATTRRQVFRLLAGALGSLPAVAGGPPALASVRRLSDGCAPGLVDCGSVCVDLESDPNHCGSCVHACAPGQACCGSTLISPFGLCVDVMSDPSNCGGCGSVCAANHVCVNGGCLFFGCAAPLISCAGDCVDPLTDLNNCGFCGNVCAVSGWCQNGQCFACLGGVTNCGGTCVDLLNDPANCGMCGHVCPTGVCEDGFCAIPFACSPGLTDCGGFCADLANDWMNCGACGNACASAVCQGGVCVSCGPGLTDCGGGVCADLLHDPANCGACGNACTSGLCLGAMCATPACELGETSCGDICADLTSDPANCGACGFGCGGGACQDGVCTVEFPPCAPGLSRCGWFCVDIQNDPFNCGSCEFVCLPNQTCVAGVCTDLAGPAEFCPPALTMCGATCVDLLSHPFHCGECFHDCAGVPPPGQSSVGQCVDGACHVVCEPGYTDCGDRCVDLATNRHHCGACGAVCPHEQTCVNAECVSATTPPTMTPAPVTPPPSRPTDKWDLWSAGATQLRGAHIYQRRVDRAYDDPDALGSGAFGPVYTQDDFDALAALGANYVEISHPGLDAEVPPYDRDEAVQDNLDRLLEMAAQANLFAVIGFRTGPGRSELGFFRPGPRRSPAPRLTGPDPEITLGDLDDRVWLDGKAQDAWGKMWYETAQRYRDNLIVVGYNLMVEPNANAVVPGSDDPADFYPTFADTLADWNRLTPWLTRAVRDVDPETPILISPLGYGAIAWLPSLKPTGDRRTVYRVNQLEPRRYVLSAAGPDDPPPLSFPGEFDESVDGMSGPFDRAWLARLLQPIDAFAATSGAPQAVAAFGALRWQAGIAGFIGSQMEVFERQGLNHGLWLWPPAGESWTEIDELSFRHGPDPDQHEPTDSELLAVVRADWQRNIFRPSSA